MSIRSITAIAVAALALSACSGGATDATGDPVAERSPEVAVGGTGSGSGAAAGGSGGLASCLAFSVEALAEREWAFDGTVAEISPPQGDEGPYVVRFDVTGWYRGGPETTATVETYDVTGTSLNGALALEVGQRVLASGDDRYLWGCGFSVPYSEDAAAMFADAFGG